MSMYPLPVVLYQVPSEPYWPDKVKYLREMRLESMGTDEPQPADMPAEDSIRDADGDHQDNQIHEPNLRLDPLLDGQSDRQTTRALFGCHQLAAAALRPYDPLWIEKFGMDRAQLHLPRSPMKFDKLFRDKVLMVGDHLVVGDVGIQQNIRNTASIMGVAGMPHWLPDLQIASATSPSGYRIIPRCKGPQILVQKMMAEDPRVRPAHLSLWSVVRLFRNGADLGSLARIRDDYTFWQDRLDEWARLNGQPRRARRCLVRSGLRWYNGAFHRVLPDGSLMKLDDQYQHNPTQSAAF